MNFQNLKILLLLSAVAFLSGFASHIEARSPAVDPIRGISIDHYNEVDPETVQGHAFEQTPQEFQEQSPQTTPEPVTFQGPSVAQSDLEGQSSQRLSFAFLLFALIALPLGIWFFIHRSLDTSSTSELPDNTIDLDAHRKKTQGPNKKWDRAS